MKRRDFLGAVGATAASSLVASAQQRQNHHRIGLLRYPSLQVDDLAAFHEGLRDFGYQVGQNLLIEERYADGRPEQLPMLAAELARLDLALVVVDGTPTVLAARRVFGARPIIVVLAADPVLDGFATSFARPGGNVTGLTFSTLELAPKRLQLLNEVVPRVTRVAALYNPRLSYSPAMLRELQAASTPLAVSIDEIPADSPEAFTAAFAAAARADALLTLTDGMFYAQRTKIVDLSLRHRLPALHPEREYVQAGGLMSYGPNHPALWRLAASYVHRILSGAKPGDLPIQRPTKFELAIRPKAAGRIGISFPESIYARADEVLD